MSNVIKSSLYISLDDMKRVEVAPIVTALPKKVADDAEDPMRRALADAEYLAAKEQLMRDAEAFAEEHIRQAAEEAERLREQARAEIEDWWQMRRLDDEHLLEQTKEQGFQQGYDDGLVQAEAAVQAQYNDMLTEAKAILEQSFQSKELIIQEAEPFLLELSCAIAEKIIHKQLLLEPDWIVQQVKQVLSRRRDQGVITLCVSPSQFTFIQNAREELVLAIDSQAELQILPDASVKDEGCVIRSSFGSIDARIDTQLTEIKKELYQLAIRNEERFEHE